MTAVKISYEIDGNRLWGDPGLSDAEVRARIQAARDRRAAERAEGLRQADLMTPDERRGAELLAEKISEPIGRLPARR